MLALLKKGHLPTKPGSVSSSSAPTWPSHRAEAEVRAVGSGVSVGGATPPQQGEWGATGSSLAAGGGGGQCAQGMYLGVQEP